MGASPLTFDEITEHEEYDAWFNFLFRSQAPEDSEDPGLVVYKYDSRGLISALVNFNRVVNYYLSYKSSSCTDGLCTAPYANDEVS